MPRFETRRLVPFTAAEMFDVVADVEAYPAFLPLCESLQIIRREQSAGGPVLIARMGVGYKAIRESFTSRVTLDQGRSHVLVEYLDGPFHHLENRWRFTDTGPGTSTIDFFIEYEFRSAMLGLLMGAMFDKAFRKFAEAFEARARPRYGPAGGGGPAG
ncbi:MAG: type II toxin-antitoxin system RatA family toxin, partial [Pseudomonadota bacterium]